MFRGRGFARLPRNLHFLLRPGSEDSPSVPLEEWWGAAGKPMLVIQGCQDLMAQVANGHDLAAQYPDRVRVIDIDQFGHILPVEQPEILAGHIVAYARELGVEIRS